MSSDTASGPARADADDTRPDTAPPSVLLLNPMDKVRPEVRKLTSSVVTDRVELRVLLPERCRDAVAPTEGVEYHFYEGAFVPNVRYTIPTPSLLRQLRAKIRTADVVHTIGYVYLPSLLATTLGARTDAGVVVTVDAFPGESWSYGNRFVDSIAKLYTRGFAGRIFEAADAVVGLGEYNKPDFERFVDDQSKVEIIPNGVDTDRYRPEAMPAKTGSYRPQTDGSGGVAPRPKPLGGATEDDLVALLYVGRLDTVKGVPYLLEMLAKLRATGRQSYALTIVGDGSRREACERRCRELGITDCVSFEGWQSEVRPYYQEHDLFVLPSISEGLPTVLTEAQACGIPVVSTDVGGAREQVRAGEVVPCRDADALATAVERLAGDDLAARGRRAREHVEANYSLSSMGDAYVRLYRRLSENYENEQ